MTDHPVFVPTSEGPVGGIVSEPQAEARAALILLPAYGRPARSGVNAFWTRLARAAAELGFITLRYDCSREGETLPIGEGGSGQKWRADLDLRLLDQVAAWFRERIEGGPLFLAGSCSGARMAIEFAGRQPQAIAGTFLVVPYLKTLAQPDREGSAELLQDLDPVDPLVVDCMNAILTHAPCSIVVGENDDPDLARLQRSLSSTPHALDLKTVPSVALHLLDRPHLQQEVSRWLLARLSNISSPPNLTQNLLS
jgi:dienelactone hydrolase